MKLDYHIADNAEPPFVEINVADGASPLRIGFDLPMDATGRDDLEQMVIGAVEAGNAPNDILLSQRLTLAAKHFITRRERPTVQEHIWHDRIIQAAALLVPVKVGVVGKDANGEPSVYLCTVECLQEDIDLGEHYEIARERAVEAGYSKPLIAFDKTDALTKSLDTIRSFFTN